MKKIKKTIFLIIPILLLLSLITINIFNSKEYKINKVLKNEYYSYLPKEAKELVKEVYNNTGEVVLTEKNKEENVPYLNPSYVNYLSLSKEEKKEVDLIPEQYSIDYDYTKVESTSDLPSSYDLRNYNYITPMKNQKTLGICWAFSAIEQAESYLMVNNSQPYNSSTKIFSPRQMDYSTSSNGLKDYTNPYSYRDLGDGGNFYISSEIMAYGLSLVDETTMPFDESYNQKEAAEVFNYNNSNYEINATVDLPTINERMGYDYYNVKTNCENLYSNVTQQENCIKEFKNQLKSTYINIIKNAIKEKGGVVVETVSPGKKCSFKNSDNKYVVNHSSQCYSAKEAHAMHVIGWDDNYSYTYCSGSQLTAPTNNKCSSGTKVSGQGAFIVRNSWGTSSYDYIYLTYDSISDEEKSATFHYIKDMSLTNNKTWDNKYQKEMNKSDTYYLNTTLSQTYNKKISGQEKLEKVKFITITSDGLYSITIKDGTKTYTYNNILQTTYPGLYTIDLSSKNIILNNDSYTITISTKTSRAYAISNSISAYTSNVDKTPVIDTPDFSEIVLEEPQTINQRIYSVTKNIPSGEEINFSLKNSIGVDYSSYLTVTNNKVADNNINANVKINELPDGRYTLTESYQNATKNIAVKVNVEDEKIKVNYYANNGTTTKKTVEVIKSESFILSPNTYKKTGYTFKNWNTKADGTGESYNNQVTITSGFDSDVNLYAQWEPIEYIIEFKPGNAQGNTITQKIKYDKSTKLTKFNQNYMWNERNVYYKNEHIVAFLGFKDWNTKLDGTGTTYNDEHEVLNLTTVQNQTITLYAQWKVTDYFVIFDSNDGTNQTKTQHYQIDESKQLNANEFTRIGYTFTGWNTNETGTGSSYSNQQLVKNLTTTNIIKVLYAKWNPITYNIRFDSNGGTGSMSNQSMTYDIKNNLNSNNFTKSGYVFNGWNTKADGTGKSYSNQEQVTNLSNVQGETITLYAQWVKDDKLVKVYRMYNPVNGEHLYTTDAYEVSVIYKTQGWGKEGIAWYTADSGIPVYRLYNPKLGNHLYTSDKYEISVITKTRGWVLDFNGAPVMYASGDVPIYRLFNPGLQGQHHLTTDYNEYRVIPQWGWQQEGTAMYAQKIGKPETTNYYR